jgi:hypothetical protein
MHIERIYKEKEHYPGGMRYIISVEQNIAKHFLAFCELSAKLYEEDNDNLLGLTEMTARFDPKKGVFYKL